MKHLLSKTMFVVVASFSLNAVSADTSVTESSSTLEREQHDSVASWNSILEFEAAKNAPKASAYERCNPTIYTKYTSIKAGSPQSLASFTYNGGNCHRYSFSIIRNYDGHDFTVTLVDETGERVSGGDGVAVSTSIYQAGTYYWQVENKTPNSYGGMTYEVRSGG